MYKAIASVGTLLLNLGELSVKVPETSLENSPSLSKPVVENSSNQTKPVHGNSLSNNETDFDEELDQGLTSGSPFSDTASAQRRLCEALADAAADCSSGSYEGNTDDNEFIRVGSEESLLSSPEVIDLDDDSKCSVTVSSRLENSEQNTSSSDRAKVIQPLTKNHEGCTKDSDNLAKNTNDDTKPCEGSSKVSGSAKDPDNGEETVESSPNNGKSSQSVENDPGEGGNMGRRRSSGNVDPYWCITFEQFLASVLTEPLLVEYFEEQTNIEEVINTVKTEGVRDFVRDPRRSISVE